MAVDDQLEQEVLKRSIMNDIGTPAVDGQVLSSTVDGSRSWVTVALDPVFSNPESVLAGSPVPVASIDSIFTNPETRLP